MANSFQENMAQQLTLHEEGYEINIRRKSINSQWLILFRKIWPGNQPYMRKETSLH